MKIDRSLLLLAAFMLPASAALGAEPSTPVSSPLLTELEFADPGLKACVQAWAAEDFNHYLKAEDVKELGCSHFEIRNLKGIEVFEELLAIDLSHNPIEDYAPLYALGENLSFIWLWDNAVPCEDLMTMRKKLPRAWIGGIDFGSCLN